MSITRRILSILWFLAELRKEVFYTNSISSLYGEIVIIQIITYQYYQEENSMKKKLGLFITTAIFTIAVTMSAMASEIMIAGEERTGEHYETVTMDSMGDNIEIHLIPKEEYFIFKDVKNEDSIGISALSNDCQRFLTGDDMYLDYSSIPKLFYPFHVIKDSFLYNNILKESPDIADPMYNAVFMFWVVNEEEQNNYYVKFVNVPLLTDREEEKNIPEDNKEIETPSNDTKNEETKKDTDASSSEKSSSHKSSGGGGGSSTKTIATKKVDSDTYPNAVWKQEENGNWSLKKSTGETITGWAKVKNIWYHMNPETGVMSTGWLTDTDGKNYYLMDTGAMSQGWNLLDNKWFYFENNGSRFSGWLLDKNGNWYYLDANGIMLANTITPDGYKVDSSGAWIQ
jgi:glutaredoxin-related protein